MKTWKEWAERGRTLCPEQALRFAAKRRLVLAGTVLAVFLCAVLLTLRRDGLDIFDANRGALVLEVYSRTDLTPEQYTLLEEQLRALEGVRNVIPESPEEGLKKLASDPATGIDAQWLMQKSGDLKGKNTLLPWRYSLYLERWEEDFLKSLVSKISGIEVGTPQRPVVGEIHYDAERWTLTFALFRYVRWISSVLIASGLFLFVCGAAVFVRCVRGAGGAGAFFSRPPGTREWKAFASVLGIGALCGISGHLLYEIVLRASFFSGSFPFRGMAAGSLALEILAAVWIVCAAYGSYLCGEE